MAIYNSNCLTKTCHNMVNNLRSLCITYSTYHPTYNLPNDIFNLISNILLITAWWRDALPVFQCILLVLYAKTYKLGDSW